MKFFENNSVVIKIPMDTENELENQYSIYDLEIGKVTVIGIYRGIYPKEKLFDQIDMIQKMKNLSTNNKVNELESDGKSEVSESTEIDEEIHFIDVIAIIQELNFTGIDK